jgi:hypothetical protein
MILWGVLEKKDWMLWHSFLLFKGQIEILCYLFILFVESIVLKYFEFN